MKYVKKPIPVEAVQIFADPIKIIKDYPQWFYDAYYRGIIRHNHAFDGLVVNTLEGRMYAPWGSYIIKGVDGELYPCREDIFKKTYEEYKENE